MVDARANTVDAARSSDGSAAHADAGHATTDAATDAGSASFDAGVPAGYKLVFADEFNAADGTSFDHSKWTAEMGGTGNGNSELEFYTDATTNVQEAQGSLIITATTAGAAQQKCWYGTCKYTSARLVTSGHYDVTYGRIEARIQIPQGQGLWPALWMLGKDIGTTGWPGCGEIDIMENIGKEPGTVHGSLHGPGYSGGNPLTGSYMLPNGAHFADAFHVFAIEWEPNTLRFYVDDTLYETRTSADVPQGKTWVYDHPFFLLLNVAVGGQWPGSPDGTTQFPQEMRVDYVRVFQKI
ncbi:MAG TPA: glycoside hydrolase family 16 protein [Polyangiales bacterium]